MLVVAGLAYTVEASNEDEAELKLLEFLDSINAICHGNGCDILKIWVSARQDPDNRVADLHVKEESALADI